jgi:hypothetical protein
MIVDENYMEGSVTYWFLFEGETFGVVESRGESTVVDSDNMPIDYNEYLARRVMSAFRAAILFRTLGE